MQYISDKLFTLHKSSVHGHTIYAMIMNIRLYMTPVSILYHVNARSVSWMDDDIEISSIMISTIDTVSL